MLISLDHRFIFIKGVKVAGSSVEIYISPHIEESAVVTPMGQSGRDADSFGMKWRPRNYKNHHGLEDFYDHMPATAVRATIGTWLFEQLFKFSIIRDPFEKIKSLYFMNRLVQGEAYSLDRAIEDCSSEEERLCDNGSLIVHRVILYETLDAELDEILPLLGIPFEGKLSIRARSKARKMYVGPEVTFRPDQVEKIMSKFSFEFGIYKQRHYDILSKHQID